MVAVDPGADAVVVVPVPLVVVAVVVTVVVTVVVAVVVATAVTVAVTVTVGSGEAVACWFRVSSHDSRGQLSAQQLTVPGTHCWK